MRKDILLILSIFTFIASYAQSNLDISKDNHTELINNNKFIGKWYAVESIIPGDAILIIDSNYKFLYAGRACIRSFGSIGNWMLNGDTLILNSLMPEKCYYISEFGECVMLKMVEEEDDYYTEFWNSEHIDDFVIYEPKDSMTFESRTSIKGCKPEFNDPYVLFMNEKFIIEDNLLKYIKETECEIKINFTTNPTGDWIINAQE